MNERPDKFSIQAHYHPHGTIDVTTLTAEFVDAWLPRLGPTSVLVWQYLARQAAAQTTYVTVDDLVAWSGCQPAVIWKTLDRLIRFNRLQWVCGDALSVEVSTSRPTSRPAAA